MLLFTLIPFERIFIMSPLRLLSLTPIIEINLLFIRASAKSWQPWIPSLLLYFDCFLLPKSSEHRLRDLEIDLKRLSKP